MQLYEQTVAQATAKNIPEAEKANIELLKVDPEFVQAIGALAYCMILQDRPDEAINLLNPALVKHPKYARGYFRLAQAYRLKGNSEKAAQNFEKAKQLDPDDPYTTKVEP